MKTIVDLILRQVRPFGGKETDIAIKDGRIAAMGPALAVDGPEIAGGGRDILPGLVDHHIHLFATAAKAESVDLSDARSSTEISEALRAAAARCAPYVWVRATGFIETGTLPDRAVLDGWLSDCPLRVQARTGGLWLLNSMALVMLGTGPWPECVERDATGQPTGRIWRGDDWLREAIGGTAPSLALISRDLARFGITEVTDAGARNGPAEGALFDTAIARGDLLQKLTVMGREDVPASPHYRTGPLKLLYDENALPDVEAVAERIRTARHQGRSVAAHCVTLGELLFFLAALDAAGGARAGDRIEHGSVIPQSLIPDIAAAGLTVVSQPGFVRTRGDRYRATIQPDDLPDLYRLRSLLDAGIALHAGSDAPYGDIDPWAAIDAAMRRTTASCASLGPDEALSLTQALSLYLGSDIIQSGMLADLCLLDRPIEQLSQLDGQNPVALTLIAGRPAYQA